MNYYVVNKRKIVYNVTLFIRFNLCTEVCIYIYIYIYVCLKNQYALSYK